MRQIDVAHVQALADWRRACGMLASELGQSGMRVHVPGGRAGPSDVAAPGARLVLVWRAARLCMTSGAPRAAAGYRRARCRRTRSAYALKPCASGTARPRSPTTTCARTGAPPAGLPRVLGVRQGSGRGARGTGVLIQMAPPRGGGGGAAGRPPRRRTQQGQAGGWQAGRMRTHPAKARREAVHHMTDRQRTLPNLASDRCRPRAPGPMPWGSIGLGLELGRHVKVPQLTFPAPHCPAARPANRESSQVRPSTRAEAPRLSAGLPSFTCGAWRPAVRAHGAAL